VSARWTEHPGRHRADHPDTASTDFDGAVWPILGLAVLFLVIITVQTWQAVVR
jgi:hypothetical protein